MGFLDMFDDPNILQNLLGISPANAAPAKPPTPSPAPPDMGSASFNGGGFGGPPVQTSSYAPPPPPSVMGLPQGPVANAQRSDAIQNVVDNGGNFGPNMSFDQRAAPIQADIANGVVDPQGSNYTDFSRNPNQPNPPPAGGGTIPPMAPPATVAGPATMPRPPMPPGAPPPRIMTADASGNVPFGGAPAPVPPPSVMNGGPPPMTGTAGGLGSSMGLTPANTSTFLASLGKGLSAVGAQRPGAFGAQSFAAGAGGALQGGVQQQNQIFNQKSQAFKDWMTNNLDEARAQYFSRGGRGANGSNAWQNTPYGRAQALEKMLDNWESQQRLMLKAKWQAKGSTPEEVQSDLDNLAKQKEAERTRRSQALGIDANEYQRGTSKDQPFDFNKLTPQQRLEVPDGAYFKYHDPSNPDADKNGDVIKQRDWLQTPPYEGYQPGGPAQAPQQPQSGPSPLEVMM